MRYALGFLCLAAMTVGAGWVIALWPGMVEVNAGDYRLQASLPICLLALLLLCVVFYIVFRLLGLLLSVPRRVRRSRTEWQRNQGDKAATQALVALAGADATAARAHANKARYWLGDTPQTLLLVAQSEHLAGRDDAAEEALRCLVSRKDVGHVGLRGLLRQAIARRDWRRAENLIAEAQTAYPGAPWLRHEQAQIAMQNGAWRDALRLSGPGATDAPYGAALAAAASFAEADPKESLRLSRQAFKADPSLTPAVLQYSRALQASGSVRRAQAILARAYAINPHPALADAYLASADSPLQKVREAERLTSKYADHPESHLLLARLSLEAGLTGEARRHAELLRAERFDQRRLWVLLADIAAANIKAGTVAEPDAMTQEDALRRALAASPDPAWHCGGCGNIAVDWQPVCQRCYQPGLAVWGSHAVTGVNRVPVMGRPLDRRLQDK